MRRQEAAIDESNIQGNLDMAIANPLLYYNVMQDGGSSSQRSAIYRQAGVSP